MLRKVPAHLAVATSCVAAGTAFPVPALAAVTTSGYGQGEVDSLVATINVLCLLVFVIIVGEAVRTLRKARQVIPVDMPAGGGSAAAPNATAAIDAGTVTDSKTGGKRHGSDEERHALRTTRAKRLQAASLVLAYRYAMWGMAIHVVLVAALALAVVGSDKSAFRLETFHFVPAVDLFVTCHCVLFGGNFLVARWLGRRHRAGHAFVFPPAAAYGIFLLQTLVMGGVALAIAQLLAVAQCFDLPPSAETTIICRMLGVTMPFGVIPMVACWLAHRRSQPAAKGIRIAMDIIWALLALAYVGGMAYFVFTFHWPHPLEVTWSVAIFYALGIMPHGVGVELLLRLVWFVICRLRGLVSRKADARNIRERDIVEVVTSGEGDASHLGRQAASMTEGTD